MHAVQMAILEQMSRMGFDEKETMRSLSLDAGGATAGTACYHLMNQRKQRWLRVQARAAASKAASLTPASDGLRRSVSER